VSETVLSGFDRPTSLRALPDGRLLITLQPGTIRQKKAGSDQLDPVPYLVLNDVESDAERGLLDLAIDPEYDENGFVYVYYTKKSTLKHQVSRFTEVGGVADPGSEFLVWRDPQSWQTCCHKGGGLDFGPDGMLYLTTGDSYIPDDSQKLTTARGKVLRFGPDGTIPPDNPYVDGPGGAVDEIWARGLRNPFRARWDLATETYLIGEVGGNDNSTSMEDVHALGHPEPAVNFGWPYCEGACGLPEYSDPIYTYPHAGTGAAVIGGLRYRGSSFPGSYQGAYFFADYVDGWIKTLLFDSGGTVTGVQDFDLAAGSQITALEVGTDGALYYARYGAGSLHRIRYETGNHAPVITQAEADVTSGGGPQLTVTFTGAATDAEQDPLTYTWVFGDGQSANGEIVAHTYNGKGVYQAVLEVFDGLNTTSSDPIQITIGDAPVIQILTPADGTLFRGGDTIAFQGDATDVDETLGDDAFRWTVLFHHNEHTHPGAGPFEGTRSGSFDIETTGHDYHGDTFYEIVLEVTDSDGLTTTGSVYVLPDKVDVAFDTLPPGLSIEIDGVRWATPLVYDALIGFEHVVSLQDPQCVDGLQNEFLSWSDGGAPTHVFVVPDQATGLTATFDVTGPCTSFVGGQIALYDFLEGGGSIVHDVSGTGVPLDLVLDDQASAAWLLNGGIEVFQPTRIASQGPATKLLTNLAATGEVTIDAWIRPDPIVQIDGAHIVGLLTDPFLFGGSFTLSQLADDGVGLYGMRLRTSVTDQFGQPGLEMPIEPQVPHVSHVVYTRLANGVTRFYQDGELVVVGSAGGTLEGWNAGDVFVLANEPSNSRPWLGQIRSLSIYDRALTQEEVDVNYLAGRNRFRPFAAASADVQAGYAPLAVHFDGSASSDLSGSILAWDWDFGDGASESGTTVDHVFDIGVWTVTLTVTDDEGGSDEASLVVTVTEDPVPHVLVEPEDVSIPEGFRATFSLVAGGEDPLAYQWQRDGIDIFGATEPSYTTPPTVIGEDGTLLRCVVTNSKGSATSREALLSIFPAPPRVTAGLVSLYAFHEGAGSTVQDVSGVGSPLDLVIADPNAVTWLQGGGLSVDAPTAISSPGAATKVSTALEATSELSFEAWIQPASTNQIGPARIVALSTDPTTNGCSAILGQTRVNGLGEFTGRVRTSTTNGFGTPAITTDVAAATLAPTHLVLTRASSGVRKIFVDGLEAKTDMRGGTFATWDPNDFFVLANEPTGDKPWLGELFLVGVYDRDLSAGEVLQNYHAGPGTTPPNDPPTAVAAADPSSGKAPLAVWLDASPSYDWDGNLVGYEWDFGDGDTGSGAVVSHTYASQGSYTATVTITDDDGAQDTTLVGIEVAAPNVPPAAVASSDVTSGKVPLTVQFDGSASVDPDGAIVSYDWDFGDGEVATGALVSHQYVTPDSYTATLVVTDEDGATDEATILLDVGPPNVPPVAVAGSDVASGPAPLSVLFDGTSSSDSDGTIVDYAWDFGDGKSAHGASVPHVYKFVGTYAVTLVVTDSDGAVDSAGLTIDVLPSSPAIVVEPQDQDVPQGFVATFRVKAEGAAVLHYQWQWNQVDIPGATSRIYHTGPTSGSDDGALLRCVVTNDYGSATSIEAQLHVGAPPPRTNEDGGGG